MGDGFQRKKTERQKLSLERYNVQRMVFVPLFLAVLAIGSLIFMRRSDAVMLSQKISIATAFYAVVSVAFSVFFVQLLKRKSRKSELWLFQMLYIIANTSFLTYISYAVFQETGSMAVYVIAVLIGSCSFLYQYSEYMICAGIECLMPLMLYLEEKLTLQQFVFLAAVHLAAGFVVIELCHCYKKAEQYRRKYVQEVKAAETDPLTKVNNRRGMMRRVMSVWPALEQANRAVAVMVIDIDHFKKYNDKFGHPAGDGCLCRVADVIKRTVNGTPALVARIGGEEFLVFVHGINSEEAYSLAEQIRRNVEDMAMPHSEEAKYRYVTVSIGVATDRCSSEISFGGLYRRGDRDLYKAKNSGRNRVGFRENEFSTRAERKVNIR